MSVYSRPWLHGHNAKGCCCVHRSTRCPQRPCSFTRAAKCAAALHAYVSSTVVVCTMRTPFARANACTQQQRIEARSVCAATFNLPNKCQGTRSSASTERTRFTVAEASSSYFILSYRIVPWSFTFLDCRQGAQNCCSEASTCSLATPCTTLLCPCRATVSLGLGLPSVAQRCEGLRACWAARWPSESCTALQAFAALMAAGLRRSQACSMLV